MSSNMVYNNIFVIDSFENRCAMDVGFKIVDQISMTNLLFICFDDEFSTKKLLKNIKQDTSSQDQTAKFFFLKDSWQKIYDEYGHKKFIMELLSFIKHSNTNVIFLYRIDKVLIGLLERESKLLIEMLFDELKSNTKKIILNYDSTTIHGRTLREYIGNNINLEYKLKSAEDCSFTTIDKKNVDILYHQKEFGVLLLSSDEELIHAHKILFDKKDNFIFFQGKNEDFIHKSTDLDLVIIHDDNTKLNFALIKEIMNIKKGIKIIYLNRKRVLRLEDKVRLKDDNILYIDGIKSFEEYVEKLEFTIGRDFYFKRVKEFFSNETIYEIDDLQDLIKRLEENKILYSLASIKDKKLKDARANDLKSLFRDNDFIFKNGTNGEFFFVLVNLLEDNAKKIISKRLYVKKKMIKLYKRPIR